jgi:hypothetical protein
MTGYYTFRENELWIVLSEVVCEGYCVQNVDYAVVVEVGVGVEACLSYAFAERV